MNWNHDLSQAPRGKMVHSTRTVGDRVHEISDFVAEHIWAASKCGKVIKSYWIPPVGKAAGRWSGFATGEAPIAWQLFVVPEHPSVESSLRRGASSLSPEELKKLIAEGRAFVDTNPEARFIEDGENACPHCGGSGHKDDVITKPQRQQGTDGGEIAAVKGKARLANATGVEPSPSGHLILEDVGGGA